jgi:hypothetical protein
MTLDGSATEIHRGAAGLFTWRAGNVVVATGLVARATLCPSARTRSRSSLRAATASLTRTTSSNNVVPLSMVSASGHEVAIESRLTLADEDGDGLPDGAGDNWPAGHPRNLARMGTIDRCFPQETHSPDRHMLRSSVRLVLGRRRPIRAFMDGS